jgi:hypothetical protein
MRFTNNVELPRLRHGGAVFTAGAQLLAPNDHIQVKNWSNTGQ